MIQDFPQSCPLVFWPKSTVGLFQATSIGYFDEHSQRDPVGQFWAKRFKSPRGHRQTHEDRGSATEKKREAAGRLEPKREAINQWDGLDWICTSPGVGIGSTGDEDSEAVNFNSLLNEKLNQQ